MLFKSIFTTSLSFHQKEYLKKYQRKFKHHLYFVAVQVCYHIKADNTSNLFYKYIEMSDQ